MMQFSRRPFQGFIIIKMCPEVDFVTVRVRLFQINPVPQHTRPGSGRVTLRNLPWFFKAGHFRDRAADSMFQTNWRWKRSKYGTQTRPMPARRFPHPAQNAGAAGVKIHTNWIWN
jgi:hypothetical protein